MELHVITFFSSSDFFLNILYFAITSKSGRLLSIKQSFATYTNGKLYYISVAL